MLNPRIASLVIAAIAFAIIAGAWMFEYAGYAPCELCLLQRWPYYVGIPFALIMASWNPPWIKATLWLMALLWAGSAIFGTYHSGVEWGWWQGPTTCSGGDLNFGEGLPDLTKTAVKCNEAALRIFGLSLAGWNAVVSAVLAAIAVRSAR
jgi:disulfide bond formation protein DsbB